jgi:hypothetical protein
MALTQVSTDGVKDGSLLNADINASAAIDGSKITPTFTSTVNVTNTLPEIFLTDTNTSNARGRLNANAGSLLLGADNDNAAADSVISFAVDGGEKARIDSSGRVGIGTTSPSSALEVSRSAGDTILELNRSNTNTTGNVGIINFTASDGHSVGSIGMLGDGDNEGGNVIFRTTSAAANNDPFNAATPERMRIDSSGHVGIGTTTPDQLGAGSDSTILAVIESSGTRRGQLLLGDNQNVDTGGIGDIHFVGKYQNSGHKDMACIKAQAAGSTSGQRGAVLIFETKTDGTAAIAERMRIDSSGTVFVGTTNVGGGSGGVRFKNPDVGSSRFGTTITSGSKTLIQFISNGANNIVGSIGVTTTATDFSTSSDYRLKENESLISDGITRLKQLKPYKFNWKSDSSTKVDGFFAHEVSSIVPEAVTGIKDAVAVQEDVDQGIADAIGEPIYQGIDQSKLVPLLTAALQEEIAKREALEARVAALEAA